MFAFMQSLTCCGFLKGSETHASVVPSASPETPGNRIVIMFAHASASSRVPIVAPASVYAWSE